MELEEIIVVLSLIIVILVIMLIRKKREKSCTGYTSKCVEKCVKHILELSKEIKLIEELQYEKACKEALMEDIHDMFFFKEIKFPKEVKMMFKKKIEELEKSNFEEDKQIAEMYRQLVAKIKV